MRIMASEIIEQGPKVGGIRAVKSHIRNIIRLH